MKTTDTHVYFWRGEFSNWHPCQFVYLDNTFHSTEQAFMWRKAMCFKDKETADKILLTTDSQQAKRLGRLIKNYNEEIWGTARFWFMVYVNIQKFKQNPNLKKLLIDTENRILVEASPYDKIWGVGLEEENPLILDEKNWLGTNLLGKALMEVRNMIKFTE